jgi:hypothetical protein
LIAAKRDAWGFSLFCDDIRAEVGGKISVMGIYQADMIFTQDPPIVLPKFAILVKYYETPGVFTDDVVLKVFFPGDEKDAPTLAIPIPRQSMQIGEPQYEMEEGQEHVFSLAAPVVMAPFQVTKYGFLKVRAACGDAVTNLGSLMLRKIRPDEKISGIND